MKSYTIEQLVRLGISWVWMGLEGQNSSYAKLSGVKTRDLVKELQAHGIRVLGSTIIGLEEHTPDNIRDAIDYAVSHDTVFHQFMLYTPLPGTPLYEEHKAKHLLLDEKEMPVADIHGQYRFNYHHPHIAQGQETTFLQNAFSLDFMKNGPSLARMIRVMMDGWRLYKNHPDPCVRTRLENEIRPFRTTYAAAVFAMKMWFRKERTLYRKLKSILSDMYKEFGWKTRIIASTLGLIGCFTIWVEKKRLAQGWTYEPPTFYEKNARALELERSIRVEERVRMSRKHLELPRAAMF